MDLNAGTAVKRSCDIDLDISRNVRQRNGKNIMNLHERISVQTLGTASMTRPDDAIAMSRLRRGLESLSVVY